MIIKVSVILLCNEQRNAFSDRYVGETNPLNGAFPATNSTGPGAFLEGKLRREKKQSRKASANELICLQRTSSARQGVASHPCPSGIFLK